MNPVLISEEYIFIIDTNSEANFAKFLCAYCTGYNAEVYDEDQLEKKMSDLFYMENGLEDDDSPKGRVALQKNPFYGSINDHKDEDGIFTPCSVWLNRDYGTNEAGDCAKLTEENCNDYDFPAPFSVGIFFDIEPTEQQIKIIKERAVKFFKEQWPLKHMDKTIMSKVEGFRLISHKKYGEEKEI